MYTLLQNHVTSGTPKVKVTLDEDGGMDGKSLARRLDRLDDLNKKSCKSEWSITKLRSFISFNDIKKLSQSLKQMLSKYVNASLVQLLIHSFLQKNDSDFLFHWDSLFLLNCYFWISLAFSCVPLKLSFKVIRMLIWTSQVGEYVSCVPLKLSFEVIRILMTLISIC